MALVADLLQQTFVILLIGRVLGTKDVSCPEFLQGLPVLTGSFIREAKLVMGMCIVRAQARGLAEFRDRPVPIALVAKRQAQVEVCTAVLRIQAQGLAILQDCPVPITLRR